MPPGIFQANLGQDFFLTLSRNEGSDPNWGWAINGRGFVAIVWGMGGASQPPAGRWRRGES